MRIAIVAELHGSPPALQAAPDLTANLGVSGTPDARAASPAEVQQPRR